MEMLAALDLAHREFDRALRQVGDDQWSLPTPCREWDVAGVANHVLAAGFYFMALLDGASREDALELLGQDFSKGDPVKAFEDQRAAVRDAFAAPGALERVGHHVVADLTGAQLLAGAVSETAVHTWDVMRAASIGPPLDAGLAEVALGILDGLVPIFVEWGFTAPSVEVAPEAPVQSRMAALAGRQP
jgi:uncharacterized protein (TIGR03086 family)